MLLPSTLVWAALLAVISAIMTLWAYLFAISFRYYMALKCPYVRATGITRISVIVPARNEQEYIGRCLHSLLEQDYPDFEIIAVDDNSTDRTLQIMKSIEAAAGGKLKVVCLASKPDGWTGKTWASHQGYMHSNGDVLLFTDADTFYNDSHALSFAISYMAGKHLDVLTGVPHFELKDFWFCSSGNTGRQGSGRKDKAFRVQTGDGKDRQDSISSLVT